MASRKIERVLIKFPSRGRPIWFLSTLHRWIGELSNKYDIDFVVCIDEDDDTMNNTKMLDLIKQIGRYSPAVFVSTQIANHSGCVEACNMGLDSAEWDLVLTASDDLIPIEHNFDAMIVEDYLQHYPDLDGVIYYHDGRHKPNILTFPIMGRAYYDYMGFMLDPVFVYQGADRDLHRTAETLGKLVYIDSHRPFHHEYKKYGQDDTYKRSHATRMQDKHIAKKRNAEGYYDKFKDVVIPV